MMSAIKAGPLVSEESGKMVPAIKEGERVSEESGKTVPDKPAHRVNPGSLDPIEQSDVSEDELVISIL
jgi:hypothetical protein